MSFLDKAKQAANANNTQGGSPMNNPFIKTTQKPSIPGAPTPSKPAIPGAKPVAPIGKPPVPGAKPAIPGVPAKPSVPTPAPTPVVEPQEPVVPQESTVVQEVKEEVKEVVVKEEVKEVKETTKEEVQEVTEAKTSDPEYTEEELATMSPQKRAAITRKRNADAKKKAQANDGANSTTVSTKSKAEEVSIDPVVVPSTELSFADCVTAIKSQFVDQEWEAFRAEIIETQSEIMISNDMNKPQIHDLLSQISLLRDKMGVVLTDTKTLYESLTDKEDGLINRVKRLNGKGTNGEERKISGTVAAMNYKSPEGHNINLFELLDETRSRYNFLKSVQETIDFKKAVLLTMLASLKLEK